ncbi:MAG: LemA family protein [Pseudomonadota bacterium]
MSTGWICFLLVLIAPIVWAIVLYNRLVSLRNQYKNSFAQIDVQLKRRYDLIPNLVETAKHYMQHERESLTAVIAARNSAALASQRAAANPSDEQAIQQFAVAEGALNHSLGQFFALAEAYPDLKANQNMMQLSEELTSTENRIAFARQAYNDNVMLYHSAIEAFPANFLASAYCFRHGELLQATESAEERQTVSVKF